MLYKSPKTKDVYTLMMQYYDDAINERETVILDPFNSIKRQYDGKYDENGRLVEMKIYEYENNKFFKESNIPTDKTKPSHIFYNLHDCFEEYYFLNGKLNRYTQGTYKNNSKEIIESYEFRAENGTLKTYIKNAKIDSNGVMRAEEKYEFNSRKKLTSFNQNVEI